MSDEQPPTLDLSQWVSETAPALLDAEEGEGWGFGTSDPPRPVTAALTDGSPLRTYLADEGTPAPADLSRAERTAWYAEREQARQAAEDAAEEAQRAHERWARVRGVRQAADTLDARLARVAERQRQDDGQKAPAEARQPAPYGRW